MQGSVAGCRAQGTARYGQGQRRPRVVLPDLYVRVCHCSRFCPSCFVLRVCHSSCFCPSCLLARVLLGDVCVRRHFVCLYQTRVRHSSCLRFVLLLRATCTDDSPIDGAQHACHYGNFEYSSKTSLSPGDMHRHGVRLLPDLRGVCLFPYFCSAEYAGVHRQMSRSASSAACVRLTTACWRPKGHFLVYHLQQHFALEVSRQIS